MNDILRPVTPDGLIGFDEFGQLQAKKVEAKYTTSWRIWDVREKTCVICNHGWELNHKSFKDQYYWHSREEVVHNSCYERYLTLSEWEQVYFNVCHFNLAFPDGLKEVKNQYGGAWNLPWYRFSWKDAPTFTIVIGRRKRVWHMEIKASTQGVVGMPELDFRMAEKRFSEEDITKASTQGVVGMPELDFRMAEKCFSEEDITKEFGPASVLVHAWTDEKMLAYLKKFVRILGLEKPVEKVAE